jgi:hypothetical protein
MGRNYAANNDGYVYVYSPNGATEGTMNQLVMFRVPKTQILNRGAYEYFAGLEGTGNARWAKEISARAPVHTFPSGWVNKTDHPWSWVPSVTYNAPLGIYMMATWGTGCAPDSSWFGKPSYLGIWSASHPWGPWRQIHEETSWTPGNDPAARAYSPQIAPKWIAPDGKSFWLVWSDYQAKQTDECQRVNDEVNRAETSEKLAQLVPQIKQCLPYYAFNVQRVDLVTS